MLATIRIGDVFFSGALIAHANDKGEIVLNIANMLSATLSIVDASELVRMALNAIEQAAVEIVRIKSS